MQSEMKRTGKMFAVEHYDVVPDMIAMAKSLGEASNRSCNWKRRHHGLGVEIAWLRWQSFKGVFNRRESDC